MGGTLTDQVIDYQSSQMKYVASSQYADVSGIGVFSFS